MVNREASSEAISSKTAELSRRLDNWEMHQLNYERLVDEEQIIDVADIVFQCRNAVTQTIVRAQ